MPGKRRGFKTVRPLRKRALREKRAAPTPRQEQSVDDGSGAEGSLKKCAYASAQ